MLSGSIAGAVFTSPPPNSILAAIRAVANPGKTHTCSMEVHPHSCMDTIVLANRASWCHVDMHPDTQKSPFRTFKKIYEKFLKCQFQEYNGIFFTSLFFHLISMTMSYLVN